METKKIKKIVLMSAVIVAVVFAFSNAAKVANAQSEEIIQKVNNIKSIINKIAEVKDDETKSDEEKVQIEIELKIKVLTEVAELGKLQIKETREKMDVIQFPETEDWKYIKSKFYNKLKSFDDFYANFIERVSNEEDMNLDKIKAYAEELNDKKKNEIDTELHRLNDVLMAFDVSEILNLADERLRKINRDINKIYEKKLSFDNDLRELFEKANDTLNEAHSANDKAKIAVLEFYTIDQILTYEAATTSTSTASSTESNEEALFKKVEEEKINYSKKLASEIGLEKNDSEENTEELSPEDILDKYVRQMTFASLQKIRGAYDIFIQMSSIADQLLN